MLVDAGIANDATLQPARDETDGSHGLFLFPTAQVNDLVFILNQVRATAMA
jgi:hypothetical protein